MLFKMIFGMVILRGSSGYKYIRVSWLCMCIRRVFMLILALHINMRVLIYGLYVALTHGVDCEALMYKHEHKGAWADYNV